MKINEATALTTDLADGSARGPLLLTTIDGEAGWVVATYRDGSRMAYAPQHIALLTGEIAREV